MRAILIGGLTLALAAPLASGKVSEEEAARLGTQLTPTGAEVAGNADGSIPAWSGKIIGVPPGLEFAGPATVYPCLLYTSPSPRDRTRSRMPSSA